MVLGLVNRKGRLIALVLLAFFAGLACLGRSSSRPTSIPAKISRGRNIYVEHRARSGDSYMLISRRWTGSDKNWRAIKRYNGNRPLLAGAVCRIPYNLLSSKAKYLVIVNLFPLDKRVGGQWSHRVTYKGETVSSIARWFTGTSRNASKILSHNHLRGVLRIGSRVLIPSRLLLPTFKTPRGSHRKGSSGPLLRFKQDKRGRYASYRLKKGEALYTNVVARFTGRISHDDVMDAVKRIKARSGIRDVKRIPAGFEVKIPVDLLLPQYLPKDDALRRAYEASVKEFSRYRNVFSTRDLKGVYVILDPGHGGGDPGAIGKRGIREDEYAYDIACRIRRLLRSRTRAQVYMTTWDKKTGYRVRNSRWLRPDSNEVLLTTPRYKNGDATVSANLRCFLVASIYDSLPRSARKQNRVVFTSVHADSLYPEMSGATIYIPDAHLSRKLLDRRGGVYDRTKEVRACRPIKTTYWQRVRSEGYSHYLAMELLGALKRRNVATLPYHPVRDRVTRGRREYVPAVICHNPVPTKLLLETANLQNSRDCKRLMNPDYRERIAIAYVEALRRYYGRKLR
nr:hypothetical protein [Bacillota bacterium]